MPLSSPHFVDISLLLLRLMVGLVFVTSGYNHLKDPEARSKSIEMPKSITIFLGIAEVAGGLGVAFGVLTQIAALGLILIMLGAIYKKIFAWHAGFWGEKSSGWHYELMLVLMNLVIAATGGGVYLLLK
jgi:putative oxidoreductase